jgi:hypothetical protein
MKVKKEIERNRFLKMQEDREKGMEYLRQMRELQEKARKKNRFDKIYNNIFAKSTRHETKQKIQKRNFNQRQDIYAESNKLLKSSLTDRVRSLDPFRPKVFNRFAKFLGGVDHGLINKESNPKRSHSTNPPMRPTQSYGSSIKKK